MWCIFLLCFGLATASSDGSQTPGTNSLVLDSFIRRLQQENWNKEEGPCLENILTTLENVKNSTLWATWIWNANTIPTGNLFGSSANFGNFDQCIKPPWLVTHPQFSTKYCIAQFSLADNPKSVAEFDPYGSINDFINSKTIAGLPTNKLTWGVCVPAACNPPSIVKITRAMYDMTNFGSIRPNITVDYCKISGERPEYTMDFYLFMTLIASLIMTVAISTFYSNYIDNDNKNPARLEIICNSFCMVQNYRRLLKENAQEIRVMNGMRFLTAVMVVSLHEVFFMTIAGMSNIRDYDKDLAGLLGMFLHVDVVVDTFFAMSGLLHVKGLLANADKHQNLLEVLLKRYLRLIGPFALSMFYVTAVSKYAGSGPIWELSDDVIERKICFRTWKLSLLMLNSTTKDACNVVTWYIASDYQLAVLATVLFYFYRKDRRLGLAAFGAAAVFSLIIPGVLTYWYQLPAIHFMDISQYVQDFRNCSGLGYTYCPSYSRAGAYLVGVAMGYLMTVYKPADYRKTVPKTWSILGTAASLVVMVSIMALGSFYLGREYYPLETAVVAATNRVFWAVAVCCIIGFCEYGTVPVVTDILSSSIFTPLSHLSYSLYVIHFLVILRKKFSLRSPWKYDVFSIATDTVGTVTVSLGLSFIMWLLVEAPMINMCNQLFFAKRKGESKALEKNGVLHQNGKLKGF